MGKTKIGIIAVLASALLLGACGVRGSLERPPAAEEDEKPQDKKFILDPLIKS